MRPRAVPPALLSLRRQHRARHAAPACHKRQPSRGALRPSCVRRCRPPFEMRAQGRSGAGLSHGPRAKKSARGGHHRFGRKLPTFPARWLCGLYALFPGTGSLAPVVSDDASASSQNLASAPGCQNHAISPSRQVVRPHDDHAATRRAHRIPHPTSVTTAKRPLVGTGSAHQITISEK